MRLIDLSRTVTTGMPVHPGDPVVRLAETATIAENGFLDTRVETGTHAGTHLDAPAHFVENGLRVSELDVAGLIGPGRLVDARGHRTIDATLLHGVTVQPGDLVLVWTDWEKFWGKPKYFTGSPELTADFAQRLADAGVAAVGLDSPSPDRPPHTVHKLLLEAGIVFLENLIGLKQLAGTPSFEVIALPAKWQAEAAPVRVVAKIP